METGDGREELIKYEPTLSGGTNYVGPQPSYIRQEGYM